MAQSLANGLYTINGQPYELVNKFSGYGGYPNSVPQSTIPNANGNIVYQNSVYKPYKGLLGESTKSFPSPPFTPNAYTGNQLNKLNNGYNPYYQQYLDKMATYGAGAGKTSPATQKESK